MIMKKLFLMVVMAIATLTVSAQVDQGFRMGARVNAGVSNVIFEGDKCTFGYGLGWIAEYNFSSNLFLQSGVGLENIAHKEDGIDGTINSVYAQLPIHLGYRTGIGNESSFFIQGGPTIGIGLFGSDITSNNQTINYFDLARRFDLGIGGRVGIEFNKYQISAGVNYGLTKVFEGIDAHTLSANIGFAYMF